jgi:hypothetical protein
MPGVYVSLDTPLLCSVPSVARQGDDIEISLAQEETDGKGLLLGACRNHDSYRNLFNFPAGFSGPAQ